MDLLTKPTAPALENYLSVPQMDPLRMSYANQTIAARNAGEQIRYNKALSEYNAQQAELTRRTGEIDRGEADDIAGSNAASAGRLNTAALAQERRRAGGTTFRRRGSGVSANQLVSGLGTANAKALAQKRRDIAAKEVGAGIGWRDQWQSKWDRENMGFTVRVGAPVATIYN